MYTVQNAVTEFAMVRESVERIHLAQVTERWVHISVPSELHKGKGIYSPADLLSFS